MLIVGLTGSIGMGKSAAASHLAVRGVAMLDADAEVHRLYDGAAAPLIEAAFPGAAPSGRVDRRKLSAALAGRPDALRKLEAIVHPLVREAEWRFLQSRNAAGAKMAALEIPLLFETGADALTDATIVLSAPADVQKARVLARPGMTEEKFAALNARQMPDAEKRARASFVVNSGGTLAETHAALDAILAQLEGRIGEAFARWRAMHEASR